MAEFGISIFFNTLCTFWPNSKFFQGLDYEFYNSILHQYFQYHMQTLHCINNVHYQISMSLCMNTLQIISWLIRQLFWVCYWRLGKAHSKGKAVYRKSHHPKITFKSILFRKAIRLRHPNQRKEDYLRSLNNSLIPYLINLLFLGLKLLNHKC